MFYDYFLTFDDEIKYVWPSKRSLPKALYFATTYFNFMNLVVSVPGFFILCTRIVAATTFQTCLGLITICTAESVLLFRTWVLWEKSRNTGIGLLGLFAFLAISSTIFIAFGIQQQGVANPQPVLGSITFFSFFLLVFYESVMLGLNIYKAKQHFASVRHRLEDISLAVILLRDGILYYIFVLSISLTITGFLVAANKPILINISGLHVTLHSVLTKRMFLSLRSVAAQDSSDSWEPNSTFVAVSGPQF
ncbi:hypothetical protein K439DRAFT_1628904 [Ramaria rubella]|nr:hypothetical protein K439DRAFT_1628904 [Ramaria rubella]